MTQQIVARRVPRQERGERRVARLLDAAAEVFAEKGYEAATTNLIAERAETSIGSLYQFFPNKESILRALADRYAAQVRALYDRVLVPEAAALPLPALLDSLIDPLVEFCATTAGFAALVVGGVQDGAGDDIDQEVFGRVEAIYAARAPGVDPSQIRLSALVSVQVVKTLLSLIKGGASEHARLVAEFKHLLRAYLAHVIGD